VHFYLIVRVLGTQLNPLIKFFSQTFSTAIAKFNAVIGEFDAVNVNLNTLITQNDTVVNFNVNWARQIQISI
jgi:hypothetical protein